MLSFQNFPKSLTRFWTSFSTQLRYDSLLCVGWWLKRNWANPQLILWNTVLHCDTLRLQNCIFFSLKCRMFLILTVVSKNLRYFYFGETTGQQNLLDDYGIWWLWLLLASNSLSCIGIFPCLYSGSRNRSHRDNFGESLETLSAVESQSWVSF